VESHLGRVEEAQIRIDEGLASYQKLGVGPAGMELLATRGFLEVSLVDWLAADRTLEDVRSGVEASGLREPALFRHHSDAIEAKIALGLLGDARARLEELELLAERLDRTILDAIAGRCRVLLSAATGDLTAAYPSFDRALELHAAAEQPFEEARTLLALGSVQRRDRKKRATRESLGRAGATFDALGARLWSERVQAELARVGGRPSTGELTPTEARVAELIAAGHTYRETADALFISPKTVQWNLSKIYRKLGVRSRAELAARLPSGGPDVAATASASEPPVGS
jgi:DNA-binding CsgD family transcriptional regulator